MTKKRSTFGRIILFLLFNSLIAGGFLGYRYYLSQQKSNYDEPVFKEFTHETEEEVKSETLVILEKIGETDWVGYDGRIKIRFSKPRKEGDVYVGEFIEDKHNGSHKIFMTYELLSDDKISTTAIKEIENGREYLYDQEIKIILNKIELDETENNLTIHGYNRGNVITFTRM